ncbi:NUDIX hydrolase [Fulvivirgaceae bacterium BMA12]|uniref:NUDIX hydrolase n=1 Tax=Agaribacillus aureus TaxID=3051825 RepID=A0ABT8L373_9BACT|nr:NUDIX hydrolase [Fulvivirgaceae bacterium BMA12]
MEKIIERQYGHKLRTRVNGLLIEDEKILLLKHKGLGSGHLWAPPGGGIEYGSTIEENLKREFYEETGLQIRVLKLQFVNEFIKAPFHAIELFFLVERTGGQLKLGSDPESDKNHQILEAISFFSFAEIATMRDSELHNLFKHCRSIQELLKMNGYFNY